MRSSAALLACTLLAASASAAGTFHIDTGAGSFVNLGSAFVRAHGLADRVGLTYSRKGRGLTGVRRGDRIGTVAGLSFCGHELPATGTAPGAGLPAILSGATSGVLSQTATSGLIGNAVLLRFNILFDLDRRQIFLRPNRAWRDPILADASGLRLVRRPEGPTRVDEVVRSSPAAEAGLAVGDELQAIDDEEISGLALAAVRERLRLPGRTVVLVVARGGELRTVRLRTRALLGEQ